MDGSKLTLGLLAASAVGAGLVAGTALGSRARALPAWTEATSCATCGKVGPLVASGVVPHGMVCPSCAVKQSDRPDYLARAREVQKQARVPFRQLANEAYRAQRQDKSWVNKAVCASCGRPPPLQASVLQPMAMLCTRCAKNEEKLSGYKTSIRLRRLEYGVDFPREHTVGPLSQAEQQAARVRRQTSLEKRDPAKAKPDSKFKGAFSVGDHVRFRASFLSSAPSWSLPRDPEDKVLERGVVARVIPRPGLPMLLEVTFSPTQTLPFPTSVFEPDKSGSSARLLFEKGDLVVPMGVPATPDTVLLVLKVTRFFGMESISAQGPFDTKVRVFDPSQVYVAQEATPQTLAEAKHRSLLHLL